MSDRIGIAVERIETGLRSVQAGQDLNLFARYAVSLATETKRITLWDPAILDIGDVSCSDASIVERSWKRGAFGGVIDAIVLTATASGFSERTTISVEAHWSGGSRKRLNGSSVCVLPASLPAVATGFDVFAASELPPGSDAIPQPQLVGRLASELPSGWVLDRHKNATLTALYTSQDEPRVWYDDEVSLLVGNALGTHSRALLSSLRELILEIHAFFASAYGQGHLVRALVVVDKGAYDFVRLPGQYCALDERLIKQTHSGQFPAERLVARDLAGLWWLQGVRLVGIRGQAVGIGIAMAAAIHWLRSTGRAKSLASELDLARRLILAGNPSDASSRAAAEEGRHAAEIALAIDDASMRGAPVHVALGQWIKEFWGRALPAQTILKRLSGIGVRLPSHSVDPSP